jgi:23S rRNA (guanosine2251-2'-O)-methyltransferase
MSRDDPEGERREMLYGVHPVLEALEMRRRTVDRILVVSDARGPRLGQVLRTARKAGVPISHVPRAVLSKKAGMRAVHQGVVALVAVMPYADAEELCSAAASDPHAVLVAVNQVEDPRNLGAIVRTAAAAGARGVLVGGEGAAGLTATVAKTSAGALERIGVARETRLGPRLERLRELGFRSVALDPGAGTRWDSVDLTGPLVLVAGGEARGLPRPILDAVTLRVSIPMASGVESLNVSVAVGVLLFEAARQRRMGPGRSKDEFSVPRS